LDVHCESRPAKPEACPCQFWLLIPAFTNSGNDLAKRPDEEEV